MSLVIEEAFVLQICIGICQMIVWSVIVSKLKPLVARKSGTSVLGCERTGLDCVETGLQCVRKLIT